MRKLKTPVFTPTRTYTNRRKDWAALEVGGQLEETDLSKAMLIRSSLWRYNRRHGTSIRTDMSVARSGPNKGKTVLYITRVS